MGVPWLVSSSGSMHLGTRPGESSLLQPLVPGTPRGGLGDSQVGLRPRVEVFAAI